MQNNICKLFIGCVSKNTIDACIEYAEENNVYLGLIPSRRQIDFSSGYTKFTNKKLFEYVKEKTTRVILQRDHGGPHQGRVIDDGIVSIKDDCKYYDIIHIDPWKKFSNFKEGLNCTKDLIEICNNNNYKGTFEIGTEQSIREFSVEEIDHLLSECTNYKIEYIVIQSGTSLKENKNTGVYNKAKLSDMIAVAKKYNVKTKEHNGDYIATELIKNKFNEGLTSINIAPEFGLIETNCYLDHIKDNKIKYEELFNMCLKSNFWKKWVDSDFVPADNKLKLIQICGHYMFETEEFNIIKSYTGNIDNKIKQLIKNRIGEIVL